MNDGKWDCYKSYVGLTTWSSWALVVKTGLCPNCREKSAKQQLDWEEKLEQFCSGKIPSWRKLMFHSASINFICFSWIAFHPLTWQRRIMSQFCAFIYSLASTYTPCFSPLICLSPTKVLMGIFRLQRPWGWPVHFSTYSSGVFFGALVQHENLVHLVLQIKRLQLSWKQYISRHQSYATPL